MPIWLSRIILMSKYFSGSRPLRHNEIQLYFTQLVYIAASVIDCRVFVETGCLGYVISALSSHDADMRAAALHVIYRYQVQGHTASHKLI